MRYEESLSLTWKSVLFHTFSAFVLKEDGGTLANPKNNLSRPYFKYNMIRHVLWDITLEKSNA
jgi:hypothetical protein